MNNEKIIDIDPNMRIYGLTVGDILKMSRWLMANNATVKDLDCSSLSRHYYDRLKITEFLKEDFYDPFDSGE